MHTVYGLTLNFQLPTYFMLFVKSQTENQLKMCFCLWFVSR